MLTVAQVLEEAAVEAKTNIAEATHASAQLLHALTDCPTGRLPVRLIRPLAW